jgi:Family of unknown function (DUF5703)
MRPSPAALPAPSQYEYRVVSVPRGMSRAELHRRLTEDAEYGRWELARTRVYLGGGRRIWLRRRTMRVASTL